MRKTIDLNLSAWHFDGGHPYGRDLFKSSVSKVEIEVTSYCNRVCPFCPNSLFDRRSITHYMDDTVYDRVLADLASIDYGGSIVFARYCEPLAEREFFLARLQRCRERVPNADPAVHTNGDYLTPEYLDRLYDAGLRRLVVNVYLGEHQAYDHQMVRDRVFARVRSLGHPFRVIQDDATAITTRVDYQPDMAIIVRGRNLDDPIMSNGVPQMLDRAGTVAQNAPFRRRSPCFAVFSELQIECDGTVVPCCNIRTDNPEHRGYKVGVIGRDGDIFEIWSNAAMAAWRRSLFLFGDKEAPCATCSYLVQIETPAAVAQLAALAEQFGLTPQTERA